MSKPRIFVSSTYYDLKYVRERIENFISDYCFEPILFENDNVYFHPNKNLDISCYNEVSNCHMMILIIGGRYGSLATDENKEQKRDNYEKHYVSITRKEYETAINKGIPVMIFIEQNVYTEYRTYQTNKDSLPTDFKFAYVDDIRVFEFILSLDQNAIKQFNKVDDIEHYFSHQVAGMLLAHLKQLQDDKKAIEVKNAVDEIKIVSQSMQKMVNSIAEKVLNGDSEYKNLLNQQNEALIDFFIEMVDQNMSIKKLSKIEEQNTDKYVDGICNIIYETIFNPNSIAEIEKKDNVLEKFKAIEDLQQKCTDKISILYNDLNVTIYLYRIKKQLSQILNLVNQDKSLKEYFHKKLCIIIKHNIALPF